MIRYSDPYQTIVTGTVTANTVSIIIIVIVMFILTADMCGIILCTKVRFIELLVSAPPPLLLPAHRPSSTKLPRKSIRTVAGAGAGAGAGVGAGTWFLLAAAPGPCLLP